MNITTAFNNRTFLIPRADFATSSQTDLVRTIFKRHGHQYLSKISLIDENDDCDSFLVEDGSMGFCLKISFDSVPIFYDYMVLSGISHLQISPQVVLRGEIEYGKTVYYTIQSFEYSDSIRKTGVSLLLNEEYADFNKALSIMHSYEPPKVVWPHLDDTRSFLEYQNINFENILSYVDSGEEMIFNFIKEIYKEVYDDMFSIFNQKESNLSLKKLVHGNLNASTIIFNNYVFKFINFENTFVGSPFFDMVNLIFELQANGFNEYDFVTKAIENMGLIDDRFKAGKYLNEYKICKSIWCRKKFLDLIKEYVKEVIVLNKSRTDKLSRLGHEFSNHFYRFQEIKTFSKHRDIFVQKFSEIILD